ncbi:MAG: nucleoside-triphosphatase [bacterium]
MAEPRRMTRVAAALAAGALVLTGRPQAVVAGFAGALIWVLAVDRTILRRIGRPKFWVFSISITLLAGMFLGDDPAQWMGIPISRAGFTAGLLMNLRAFTLITAGVLLAKGVSREGFLGATGRMGAAHLDAAFRQAMGTLPAVNREWRETLKKTRSPITALARLLLRMAEMAGEASLGEAFAVTGAHGMGKTEWLKELGDRAERMGWVVGGIRQERVLEGEMAVGYRVVRWKNGDGILLARGESGKGFLFDEAAFLKAAEWLAEDSRTCDMLLVDELGLLEAQGHGHAPALAGALAGSSPPLLVVSIRKDKRTELTDRFALRDERILDLDSESPAREEFLKRILKALADRKSR